MKEGKIDFDISNLSLKELVKVFESIDSFLAYLEDSRIDDSEGNNE